MSEYIKIIIDKNNIGLLLKKEKVEKSVTLLYKIQKQQFDLHLQILNKIINKGDIKLSNTEDYFFELKSTIYLHLQKFVTNFDVLEKSIQGNVKLLLPSFVYEIQKNQEIAKKQAIEQYEIINDSSISFMNQLIDYMRQLKQ